MVELPITNLNDIPGQLRNLAARIENGEYGEVETLAWVGVSESDMMPGLFGLCADPTETGHFIFSLVIRKLEDAWNQS